ncbi:zinc-binding dehydrogenase [Ligilactobacillus animalis]|nr:zinc-binding dehydrogenase [Ligilactobacillus animalis]
MKAIKLDGPCEMAELLPREVPKPKIKEGFALVRVKAFGVNESEVTSRKGGSDGDFSFPRILGIEGVGVIAEVASSSRLKVGQQVATMMGGLGRSHDGSYAEYMLVEENKLISFESKLDWGILGALPEMLQTAYGSLTKSLGLQKEEVLFIRGGSSTVGLMAITLAKAMGATVIATSRQKNKLEILRSFGCDHPLLDDETLEAKLQTLAPKGVDKVLELVGMTTLFQDISFLRLGGILCFTGALGGAWTVADFSPFSIPSGKYLTSYAGEAQDLPASVLAEVLNEITRGNLKVPIAQVYHGLDQVGQAQKNLESGRFIGKHVVVL